MSDETESVANHAAEHPGYWTFVRVWVVLVVLTTALVGLSRLGQSYAALGLLTITPLKAALVFYFFMHLKYEPTLFKAVLFVALATLLVFFALMFADVAFR
jgi:cytochrome c oxidase subunit IV